MDSVDVFLSRLTDKMIRPVALFVAFALLPFALAIAAMTARLAAGTDTTDVSPAPALTGMFTGPWMFVMFTVLIRATSTVSPEEVLLVVIASKPGWVTVALSGKSCSTACTASSCESLILLTSSLAPRAVDVVARPVEDVVGDVTADVDTAANDDVMDMAVDVVAWPIVDVVAGPVEDVAGVVTVDVDMAANDEVTVDMAVDVVAWPIVDVVARPVEDVAGDVTVDVDMAANDDVTVEVVGWSVVDMAVDTVDVVAWPVVVTACVHRFQRHLLCHDRHRFLGVHELRA